MFLFDLAKTVSLRLNNGLFFAVMSLIQNILNNNVLQFGKFKFYLWYNIF